MPPSCRAGVLLLLLAALPGVAVAAEGLASCPRGTGVLPLTGDIRGVHDPAPVVAGGPEDASFAGCPAPLAAVGR